MAESGSTVYLRSGGLTRLSSNRGDRDYVLGTSGLAMTKARGSHSKRWWHLRSHPRACCLHESALEFQRTVTNVTVSRGEREQAKGLGVGPSCLQRGETAPAAQCALWTPTTQKENPLQSQRQPAGIACRRLHSRVLCPQHPHTIASGPQTPRQGPGPPRAA